MATTLTGGSVWEEELYEHLVSHEQSEHDLLDAYQQAAADSQSPAFVYLVGLIVEDEARHHRIASELASALKSDVELRPEQPAIPRMTEWGDDPGHLIDLTDQLLQRERADAKELRRLSRELRDVKKTTMWQLLVTLMEIDTTKHIEILEFVKRHAKRPFG